MSASPHRRAERRSISEQVADAIRVFMQEQGLGPGDRLGREEDLARQVGVSRPTLREALRLLAASQLIRVGRGRAGGIFVARTPREGMSRSLSDSIALMLAAESVTMEELLDARLSLEVPIAGRAAAHASPEQLDQLEAAVEAAEGHKPGTPPFNAADSEFHKVLGEASGNQLLLALTGWILDVLQPTLIVHISGHVSQSAILDQHRAIVRAVRRGQPAAAERAMAAHIEYLIERLKSGPRPGSP
jgi:GntR family transcriptional repressor for pyruvate dehydrogenase complex